MGSGHNELLARGAHFAVLLRHLVKDTVQSFIFVIVDLSAFSLCPYTGGNSS